MLVNHEQTLYVFVVDQRVASAACLPAAKLQLFKSESHLISDVGYTRPYVFLVILTRRLNYLLPLEFDTSIWLFFPSLQIFCFQINKSITLCSHEDQWDVV